MKTPLCLDATIVGPVVELRYATHIEAFQQLYALRQALESNSELLSALRAMLHDDDHDEAKSKAYVAIYKATGESH